VTLRERHRLRVLENRVLRRIFGIFGSVVETKFYSRMNLLFAITLQDTEISRELL
jgi:hypothetical protein